MEGNMVNPIIESIKNYFDSNLVTFSLVSEKSHGPFWQVIYKRSDTEIKISGDIAFSIEISIGDSKFPLWQYDRSVNQAMQTSDKNILYQLGVLQKFLS